MTEPDRELQQRIEELFSGGSDSPPAAPLIESVARALEALPTDLWKTVLDHLPLPVYLKDREHTWVAVNNACGDLLGRPAAALIGHVDKEQSDEAWQLDDQVLETNQPGDTQVAAAAPDGTIHLRRTRRVPLSIADRDAPARYVLGIIEELEPAPAAGGTVQPGAADQATVASALDNSQLLRLQTIVDATPIPILITRTTDGRPLYINARASVLFGVAREDLLNHTTLEFYDDAADHQKILGVLQREGRVSNYELRLKRSDGAHIWAMLDVQPLVYNGEHAVFSSFYDITARRQAEEQLRNSETLYQSLVESIPENLCRKDKQGRFTYGNRRYCELMGLSLEELIGKTDFDIHPPDLAEKYRADDQAVMASGKTAEFLEAHVVLGSGEQNFVRTIKNPLYDARGQVTGIQIMFWDATKVGRAEQALRESEERYRDLFDNADELIQGVAPDGKFIYVNRAWREALGYTEAEAVSASSALAMFDIIHPEDRPHYTAFFDRLMAGEQVGSLAAKSRFVAKDGRLITVEGQLSATVDKEGHAVAARGIFRDITGREQIETERERLLAAEARRAVQLQAGSEIASAAASILDPDKLLPTVVELICERYDLYYAGLFLIDATGQWAELRAGTGEAGRTMLAAHHRLAISGESMIGRCAATGEARIALDVGAEAGPPRQAAHPATGGGMGRDGDYSIPPRDGDYFMRFDNPLLPGTRSEMALPLISRGRIIGALTIQSTRLAAFTPDDISALGAMAGQIATAIENARLFQETRQVRAETEARLRETQILQQFSQTVSSTLDIDHVLDALVQTLERQMGFTHIAISLIDHEARRLTTVRGLGSASGLQGMVRPLDAVQDDITMDIARRGRIEVIDGWDDRFDRAIYDRESHSRLVRAFVPVRLRDQSLGIIEAGWAREQRARITPEEVSVLNGLADQIAIAIDNTRLLNQVQAALAETGKLYAASRQLAAAGDVPGMLAAFAENMAVPDINRVVLWLFEFATGTDDLTAATVSAAWYSGQGEPPQPIGTRYSPQALRAINLGRTTEPLFSNDLMNDPHIDPNTAALLRQLKIEAMAVLPLWVGGRQLGLLLLISEHTHVFVESEIRPFTALAQQMAVAIENRRLIEQTQQHNAELATLNRIISSASETLDQRSLLSMVLSQTLELFGFDGGLITVYNETRQKLERIVRAGLPGEIPPDPAEGLENSLCACVFNSKEPMVIEDFRQGGPIDLSGEIAAGYYSYVGVPLEAKGRTVGTWCGFRKVTGPFSKNTLTMLQTIGRQVGFAVENARLFEQAQRNAEREHTLNRIAGRLRNAQSVEQVLNIATQELRLATMASRSVAEIAPTNTGQPPDGNGHAANDSLGKRADWEKAQR